MNAIVHDFVDFIKSHKEVNTKEEIIKLTNDKFQLVKDGKALYHTKFFAVVFCYSKNRFFSNVVLSLSKLEKYDKIPCFVVLVKKDLDNEIYMINSTFLNKISHSSKHLRMNNIKGSFLGSNIRKEISELKKKNIPEDFDALYNYHAAFSWEDNLERLVEATNDIKPISKKFTPTENGLENINESPSRAIKFVNSNDYNILLQDLRDRCDSAKDALLVASHIENVNIRGRLIEVLITSDENERIKLINDLANIEQILPTYDTKNDLGDYVRVFEQSDTYTDIKTKILYLDSNPKAYDIDKFLECMAKDKSVFMFFFVGIDENGIFNTILCSVYHDKLMESTIFQDHWSGRGKRGHAQFQGKIIVELLNDKSFQNNIVEEKCKDFIQALLNR